MQFPAVDAMTNVFRNPFADTHPVPLDVNFFDLLPLHQAVSVNPAANPYRSISFWHTLSIFGMWTAGKSTMSDGGGCSNKTTA